MRRQGCSEHAQLKHLAAKFVFAIRPGARDVTKADPTREERNFALKQEEKIGPGCARLILSFKLSVSLEKPQKETTRRSAELLLGPLHYVPRRDSRSPGERVQ